MKAPVVYVLHVESCLFADSAFSASTQVIKKIYRRILLNIKNVLSGKSSFVLVPRKKYDCNWTVIATESI